MRKYRNGNELTEALEEELLASLKNTRRPRFADRRLAPGARRELYRELRSIRAMENRIRRSRYPEVREVLEELLEESQERGITAGELADLITRRKGISFLERLNATPSTQKILLTVLILLALLAVPSVREKVRPLLKKTIGEAMELSERLKSIFAQFGESLEDIVAEAQFNRLKESLEPSEEVR